MTDCANEDDYEDEPTAAEWDALNREIAEDNDALDILAMREIESLTDSAR